MNSNKRQQIGLALGSGAARGLAHIGVIKALKEKNIPIDMIAGSSIGALIGACYAKEGEITYLEEIVLRMDWKQLARLADPNLALLFKGVFHGKKVKELLKTLIGDISFRDLKIPLAVVATDVNTGEEIVIKTGSVIDAVRASISMPAIFMPVRVPTQGGSASGKKDRFLMDGGIVNPVPVRVVKDMGATFVIACNVIHSLGRKRHFSSMGKPKPPAPISRAQISVIGRSVFGRKNVVLSLLNNKINKLLQDNKNKIQNFQSLTNVFKKKIYQGKQKIDPDTPSIFDAVIQAIYAMEYEIAKSKIKEADVIITPDIGDIAALEFYRGKEAILKGYKAAKDILSKSKMPALR